MSPDDLPPARPEDHGFARLVAVMDTLRDPGGCPWDRDQDLESLKPFLIEEAYEVLEAMDRSGEEHCEELGDLLLQIVFHSRLRRERGEFSIDDVTAAICEKLVRRHPHVFGDVEVSTAKEVLANWEQQKEREGKPGGTLGGVPKTLPALLRAQRTTGKASSLGFDWPDRSGPLAKVREELAELEAAAEAGEPVERLRHELGDLLFSVVNLARHLDIDAEGALGGTTERFVRRFRSVQAEIEGAGRSLADASLEEMDAAWDRAKTEEPAL